METVTGPISKPANRKTFNFLASLINGNGYPKSKKPSDQGHVTFNFLASLINGNRFQGVTIGVSYKLLTS
jgi:hypothetical protein